VTTQINPLEVKANDLPEKETFQWTKQWYPVAVTEFLDASRPHSIQLLGKDLVIWQDNSGKWQCFADACPHRLVPLSEGRVEPDGTLLCAYHAWRFDSQGKCVGIPQSKDAETEAKHRANPKSCAIVYPTQELQGLLWVWAESGSQAQVESQLQKPRLIPELEENSDKVQKTFWNIRDLPYGWDFFIENVVDPAHAPVSHHGIIGDRYKDAKYYDMIRLREMSVPEGFSYAVVPTGANTESATSDFQPPCHVRIVSTFKDGGKMILALYAIPTRPGWCRHIGCQVLVKNDAGKTPPGLGFFALPMPVWLGHILASLFLHQDMVFLHYQEKAIAHKTEEGWLDAVYTPNPQDKMIIAFRQWLEKKAGGGIPWQSKSNALPPLETDKRQLFDVWKTHTQHCHVCQKALNRINQLSLIAYLAALFCFTIPLIIEARYSGIHLSNLAFWGTLAASGVLAVAGYQLKRLTRLFYVYEFEHAKND
jgi:phenylpropionate dioxygenase-like ring-hydroxylating dioxygenase large terminal subunit